MRGSSLGLSALRAKPGVFRYGFPARRAKSRGWSHRGSRNYRAHHRLSESRTCSHAYAHRGSAPGIGSGKFKRLRRLELCVPVQVSSQVHTDALIHHFLQRRRATRCFQSRTGSTPVPRAANAGFSSSEINWAIFVCVDAMSRNETSLFARELVMRATMVFRSWPSNSAA